MEVGKFPILYPDLFDIVLIFHFSFRIFKFKVLLIIVALAILKFINNFKRISSKISNEPVRYKC